MKIISGDFKDGQVIELVRVHLSGMHANSPPESCQALDLSGLQSPDVSFYAAWDDQMLVGIGALKQLSPTTGEIKSMRTHAGHLRKGIAAKILEHILAVARSRGYQRLSLETGLGHTFEPAVALYRRYGFINGERFGDYEPSRFNGFLHLDI